MGGKKQTGRYRIQTDTGPAELQVHLLGPYPIINHFLGRLGFLKAARSLLPNSRESLLDHGLTLSLLVKNILVSPSPLYKIGEWASSISPAVLGISKSQRNAINDDRLARTLEVLSSVQGRSLFFQLALNTIKEFEIETKRIHQDTTSVTFQGNYELSLLEPRITYGFNKDHRPDLKQLVFGINVSADGAVPISHGIYSGNKTDDSIHIPNLDQLREILRRDDFIYVADSKLCTQKNLRYIDRYGGKFITVLPRTRAEDRKFRKFLTTQKPVRWRKILQLNNQRRKSDPPDVYWTTTEGPQQTNEGYRLIWYRSSQKRELDALAREKRLEKAEFELHCLNSRLNRGPLARKPAILKKVKKILRDNHVSSLLHVRVGSTVKVKFVRTRPGRPRKGDPLKEIRIPIYHLEVERVKEEIRVQSRADGVFPLVTNLDRKRFPKKTILLYYKDQAYVEKRHSLFKTGLRVAPVYLKKPRRVAGMIHATYLAMIVDALIEREIRRNLKKDGKETISILPEDRPTGTPTTARILEIFRDVSWYEFKGDGKKLVFPFQLSKLQKEVLKSLGMDPKTYA